jgi:CRP-like cAMP-binding protein
LIRKFGRKSVKSVNDSSTTIQSLVEYFEQLIPLKKEEKELVQAKFHPHLFLKKQFALQHGNICEYFDFVVRGCLRLYKIGDDGSYHILQFATENHWIIDIKSFHKK